MTTEAVGWGGQEAAPAQVPLSALEHYDYCPRQAGLILLEDGFAEDAATVRGTLLHQHVHEPGEELLDGIRILHALPVWHDELGLAGVCDVVEIYGDGSVIPVEHKSGGYHPGGPADVQLAGQAMCLESMFRTHIHVGIIFSSDDRRRHEVAIGPDLRERVFTCAEAVRGVLQQETLPSALSDSRCRRCSMNYACLPKVLAGQRAFTKAATALFTVSGVTRGLG